MNQLWRVIFYLIGQRTKMRLLLEAKRQGVIVYLRVLQITRRVLMAGIAVFLLFQMMMTALVAAVISGLWLLDIEPQTRLQIVFGVSVALFALPLLALIVLFSERLWYKASGARDLVESLRARE